MPAPLGIRSRRGFQDLVQSVAAPAVFDPLTLGPTGYWRANFSGAPWVAAGGSAGNLVVGTAPSVGAAQNGKTPAQFNGTTQYLTNATAASSLWGFSGAGIFGLVYIVSAVAPSGTVYLDDGIMFDNGGSFGATATTGGITAFGYDGVDRSKSIAAATGSYHFFMVDHDGIDLGITVNSVARATQACGALASLGTGTVVGCSYDATTSFSNIRLLELMTVNYKPSAADYANYKGYVNTTYALAL